MGRNGDTAFFLDILGIFCSYSAYGSTHRGYDPPPELGAVPTEGAHIILAHEQDDCHLQNLNSIFKQLKTKKKEAKSFPNPAPVSGPDNLVSIRALLTKSYTWPYLFTAIPVDNGTD